MPRAHIDLSALFGMLSDKPLDTNPEYGKKPGDVDYTYQGDPSALVANPYLKPSQWASYFHPELMQQYRQWQDAPFEDARKLNMAGQLADVSFAKEKEQFPTRQAQGLDTAAKELRQRQAIGQEFFPTELENLGKERQQVFDISKANAQDVTDIEVARQKALHKGLEEAEASKYATLGAMMRQQNLLAPHEVNLSDETIGRMRGGDLSMGRKESEVQATANLNANVPTTRATAASSGNILQDQQNQLEQLRVAEALRHPETIQNIIRNTLFNKNFQEATNVDPSRLGEARSIFRPSETSMTIEPRPGFVPESVQNYRDSALLLNELSGKKSKYESIFPSKQQSNVIPISPTATVTPGQAAGGFANGRPSALQSNTPAPVVTRPAVGAGITSEQYNKAIKNWIGGERDRPSRLREALLDEMSSVVKLPTEYVGSSVIPWTNKSTIRSGLEDPAKMAEIKKQLEALTPAQQSEIYAHILSRLNIR